MPTNPCPPSKKDRPRQPWRTKAIRNMQKKGWLISKTKPQRPKLRVERLTPEVPVLGGTWPKCNCRLNRWSWQMGVSGDPKDLSLVFQNSLKIFNLKEKHSISQTYPKQNQAADGCSRNSQAVSCCMWRTRHFLFSMGSCEHHVGDHRGLFRCDNPPGLLNAFPRRIAFVFQTILLRVQAEDTH